MFGPTIVVWLVLLVLALTVVAFVSRLVEKYRLANRLAQRSKRSIGLTQISAPDPGSSE